MASAGLRSGVRHHRGIAGPAKGLCQELGGAAGRLAIQGGGLPRPSGREPYGSNDGLVSAEQAQEWRKATSSEFSFIEFPGDHMYLVDRAQEVLDLIEAKSVDG
jgi:hypothetical protein